MRILAIENELAVLDSRQHGELLREEAACVWTLKKKDVIRDIWFTRGDRKAIVLLECADEGEAANHLETLPLVREGFISFQVHALCPYDGFDRLLSRDQTAPKALKPTPLP